MVRQLSAVLCGLMLVLAGCGGGTASQDETPTGDALPSVGDSPSTPGTTEPLPPPTEPPAASTDGGITADGGTAVQTVCTSKKVWKTGNRGDENMNPGTPCIACHSKRTTEMQFAFAGTIYPTLHEPEDCYGLNKGGTVEVTDKNGKVFTAEANAAGNFMSVLGAQPFAFPAKVVVKANGKTRAMVAEITSGDCNVCHSAAGTSGAAGRITPP